MNLCVCLINNQDHYFGHHHAAISALAAPSSIQSSHGGRDFPIHVTVKPQEGFGFDFTSF